MKTFSILTAAYNGSRHLPRLLESVRCQQFTDYEHIIIDDGSSDGGETADLLTNARGIRFWTRENRGQYQTQNELLRAAEGKYVCIINQDDAFIDEHVFDDVRLRFEQEDQPDVVYGDVRYMDQQGGVLPYRYAFEGRRAGWLLRNVSCVFHIALFFRRELVQEHGLWFDPAFQMAGDWEWNLRLYKAASTIVHIGRPISLFRVHPGQKTWSRGRRGFLPEIREIRRRHGIPAWLNTVLRWYVDLKTRLKSYLQILREEGMGGFLKRAGKKLRKR